MGSGLRKYFVIFIALFTLTSGALPAYALSIGDIRFGAHPPSTRLVFDLSEKTEFRVFLLDNPWRLVVDMPSFEWRVQTVPVPAGGHIRGIRQGVLQPGFSRIVVDMDQAVAIKSVFFLPRDAGSSDRLVIDFSPTSEAAFEAEKNKIYGRLQTGENTFAEKTRQPSALQPPPPPPHARTAALSPPVNDPADDVALPPRKPANADHYEKPLVIIDPGHGGVDPGAPGQGGLTEKNVTLAMAKELKRQLEATGQYKVKLTRDNDTYLRLHQRVNFARSNEGDLFISLHADSIGKSNVRGASVYTLSEKASDTETEMLAMRENRADLIAGVDLSSEDEVVVNILVDLTMRDTMNQSSFLANTVVSTLGNSGITVLENPHRSAGFAVLKAPDIPSILIEMGFMSNTGDAQMLSSSSFQQKMARALVGSIDAYFARIRQANRT